MFFHHNGVKPDFTRITEPDSGIVATDEKGKHLGMWEDPGWMIRDFGRDVEKALWQDSTRFTATLRWCGLNSCEGCV